MLHVALLGDSVFDNASYTGGAPDVAAHVRAVVPGARVTLCAVDGAKTTDVPEQLASVPADATHVVVSMGGNDAIMNVDLLDTPVASSGEALDLFGARLAVFEASYRAAMSGLVALGRELVACTIYDGNLGPTEASRARVALTLFNDVILREALARSLRVIDLRAVCTEPSDYANPIEPSGPGGLKIATAIARAVGAMPAASSRAIVTAG